MSQQDSLGLESFVICIPQPPTLLVDAIWEINRARMWSMKSVIESERQMKRKGDWVKKGEPIALLGAAIVSPVDGRIQMMGGSYGHCQWPDGANWPQHQQNDEFFHTVAKIQPVKGSDLSGYINETYKQVFGFLEKYIENKRYLKRMAKRSLSPLAKRLGGFEPIAPYIRKTMDKLRNAEPRVEPMVME